MSSHRIQPQKDLSLDTMDELIRWALVDEFASEEPSPQVWQNIQARVMAHSGTVPSRPRTESPLRQFASFVLAGALDVMVFIVPMGANWDPMLSPRERAYLIWRETLLLSMMPMAAAATY